ncbi:DUF2993 domain-containing protein [Parafrankia sp. EUN1f]|uniref:LmeA family phospholipid-binding protein n=1 Tax=Parafrankia sp. EUN1f TaxID=102897 RepID=UPI0001C45679|nr:DUF2993 domain-containing protein [Parafrankia sp. EUN1f]EFC82370.1 hypothetical protein FrEUN1fDRAFT_4534 [Parafrankia sp. EUN1f]
MSRTARRGLIAFSVTIIVALVILGVLDRVAARVVADQIATRAQTSQNLAERPTVSLGGFPFLTQVTAGKYRHVNIEIRGYERDGVRVDRLRAELAGVHLPLSDVLNKDVQRVPVDQVKAQVDLTFDDLNAYLATQDPPARVAPAGQGLEISGTVEVLGSQYPVSGVADIGVAADSVTFTPRDLTAGLGAVIPTQLLEPLRELLTVQVPVTGLPFNMGLRSVVVGADRLTFTAGGENVLLDADLAQTGVPAGSSGL